VPSEVPINPSAAKIFGPPEPTNFFSILLPHRMTVHIDEQSGWRETPTITTCQGLLIGGRRGSPSANSLTLARNRRDHPRFAQ
jgi:hypothetical protein